MLDEVGMTDDVDLLRLAAHVEAAGAKLVILGDDRQLGPVGPGGALGALVARYPGAVHALSENRRQVSAEEREALSELRGGEADKAVGWYVRRSGCTPSRAGTTPCCPPSTPGLPTLRPAMTPASTPGGGRTWPS